MAGRQFDQLVSMEIEKGRGHCGEAVRALIGPFGESAIELGGIADLCEQRFKCKDPCRRSSILQGGNSHGRIIQDQHSLERRKDLLQDFESLALQIRVQHRQARDISARPGQALYGVVADGIAVDCKHDWASDCGSLQRTHRLRPCSNNHIKIALSEFCCQIAQSVETALRPKILNRDVSTVN